LDGAQLRASKPQLDSTRSPSAPREGYFINGTALSLIGLVFRKSTFAGNASFTDYLSGGGGILWIALGFFKLVAKRDK
jgi:hypothetical protein